MLIPNKSVATNAENIEVNIKQLEKVEQDIAASEKKSAEQLTAAMAKLTKSIDAGRKETIQLEHVDEFIFAAEAIHTEQLIESIKSLTDNLKNIETGVRKQVADGNVPNQKAQKIYTNGAGILSAIGDTQSNPGFAKFMNKAAQKLGVKSNHDNLEQDFVKAVATGTDFGRKLMADKGQTEGTNELSKIYQNRTKLETEIYIKEKQREAIQKAGSDAGVKTDIDAESLKTLDELKEKLKELNDAIQQPPMGRPSTDGIDGKSDKELTSIKSELTANVLDGVSKDFDALSDEDKAILSKSDPAFIDNKTTEILNELAKLQKDQLDQLIKIADQLEEKNREKTTEDDLETRIKTAAQPLVVQTNKDQKFDSSDNNTSQPGNALEKVLDTVDAVADAKSIGKGIKTVQKRAGRKLLRGGRNLLGGLKNLGGSVVGNIGTSGRVSASGGAAARITQSGTSGLSGLLHQQTSGGAIKSGIGGAIRAGITALPAAVMLAGGYVTDGVAGKLGAGKDENGNDLQIDEVTDDKNWERMQILQKVESGLGRGIEYGGKFLGLGNIAREAEHRRIASETAYLDKHNSTSADRLAAKLERPETPSRVLATQALTSEMTQADKIAAAQAHKNDNMNIVNAPTTVNNNAKTQQIMRPQSRNADPGVALYQKMQMQY